jgi:steroid delta-isomerase-like uncharacterized protein
MAETAETPNRTRRPTKAKQIEQTIRDYFAAANRRNLDEMFAYYDEDVILDVIPIGVKRGAPEYRAFFEEIFAAIPDSEFTIVRVTTNASVAAVEWRLQGTFSGGPYEGVDATGSHVDLRGCDCFEVKDGKIVKNTAYYDGMAFARAIGMMPAQDSGGERAMKQAFNAVTKVRRVVQERRA